MSVTAFKSLPFLLSPPFPVFLFLSLPVHSPLFFFRKNEAGKYCYIPTFVTIPCASFPLHTSLECYFGNYMMFMHGVSFSNISDSSLLNIYIISHFQILKLYSRAYISVFYRECSIH